MKILLESNAIFNYSIELNQEMVSKCKILLIFKAIVSITIFSCLKINHTLRYYLLTAFFPNPVKNTESPSNSCRSIKSIFCCASSNIIGCVN